MAEFAQLRLNLEAWLLLAGITALPILGLWFFRICGRPLLPTPPERPIPWSGVEILIIAFFTLIFWPILLQALLTESHFLTWLYGSQDTETEKAELALWRSALAFPFQVATVLLVPRRVSGSTLSQLGLSTHDTARNVVLGWLGWFLLAPLVLTVYSLMNWVRQEWFQMDPEKHLLAQLPVTDWWLMFLTALVAAPVFEELLFRGLLQPWLARWRWGGDLAMAASLVLAVLMRIDKLREAYENGDLLAAAHELQPLAFASAMIPGYFLVARLACRWRWNALAARGIYGTALLFALFHAGVWPTPVPLFVLALGLGYLAYRTQNLIAPIVLHSLLNGVACAALLLNYVAPTNGNDATSAIGRPPAAASSKTVPDSWLPRRIYASAIALSSRGENTDEVTCPTSLPLLNNLVPRAAISCPLSFKPRSDRLTWPRSRARTTGS